MEITSIKVDCNGCGHYGENTIILEVPAGAVMPAPTRGHSAHESHQVSYHEPEPEPKPDGQKPRPYEGDPHTGQKPRPQKASPAAGDKSYDVDQGYKFDQPQAHEVGPTGAGDSHEEAEPAAVPNTEPEPKPVGGDDRPEPPKPTLQRRPSLGPASPHRALSTPIVVVSGAIARAWEGVSITVFLTTGLVFLL